jgi:membrane protease YdiL (CAAX protease family)
MTPIPMKEEKMKIDSSETPSEDAIGVQADKREQLIEVAVFLFLIGPSLVLSFFLTGQTHIRFISTAVLTILRDLSLLSLILFFLWRNKESTLRIGWTLQHARIDILLGALLFVPMFFGAASLEQMLKAIGLSVPSTPATVLEPNRSTTDMLVALTLVTIVALTEETIFRGYLMLRFDAILGSSLWSVLVSAFIFSLGHGYEGTAGVVTVGALGLIFGTIYAWRKSLVAPITMHFLQDFVSIVLLSLGVGK